MAHLWIVTERPWTATEPLQLSTVPRSPIMELQATRLRWRPTSLSSPMLRPPSATPPPQLTRPPPPPTIMPPQAMVTESQALGMELQTALAGGHLATKTRTRTRIRTRSHVTAMGPLSVTTPRLATNTANPANQATKTGEPSTSSPSSPEVETKKVTRTRTRTRPLVMRTAMDPLPMILHPTKLYPTNRPVTLCTRPITRPTTRTSAPCPTRLSAPR